MASRESAVITVRGISLWVELGIREIEKAERQEVRVDLDLHFLNPPSACVTDQISGTVDYHELTRKIIRHVESRRYAMVEKIGKDILDLARQESGLPDKITVRIHKVHPPMERVMGGVCFTIDG